MSVQAENISADQVIKLIETHLTRYPELEVGDVYKLLHQAVFGAGHAIKNVKPTREWLDREAEILQPAPAQPFVENIHPTGSLVRVHLRAYLENRGELNKLLDAFVHTAKAWQGSSEIMAAWWKIFQDAVQNEKFNGKFEARTVVLVSRTHAAANWPSEHHSPHYNQIYKPAYRVITRDLAASLLKGQKIPFTITE